MTIPRTKTVWPKLVDGHTYQFTFTGPDGEHRHTGTWKVVGAQDSSAGAFRAYVMRWTKHGKNTAVITDITEKNNSPKGQWYEPLVP